MNTRKYSPVFRIMHWLIAICMILLLVTVFLRLGWMNRDHVAAILNGELGKLNVAISNDEAVRIAKQIRKPMWNWHIYLGYALLGLYAIRMMLPFLGQMKFNNPFAEGATGVDRFKAWVYIAFYLLLGISLVTGLLIEIGPASYKKDLEAVHKLSLYYVIPFIVIHFAGILRAEFGKGKGIISRSISG